MYARKHNHKPYSTDQLFNNVDIDYTRFTKEQYTLGCKINQIKVLK